MFPFNRDKLSVLVVVSALSWMTGCGSSPRSANSGSFRGAASLAGSSEAVGVAEVTLSQSSVSAGNSAALTVSLSAPAPEGGLTVHLRSSDSTAISIPTSLIVPAGASRATTAVTVSAIHDSGTVSITALSGQTMAASTLSVVAPTTSFSLSLSPAAITVADGLSGSAKLVTKIVTGYDHSLQLSASNVPSGVSVKFNPSVIPAPGAGSSAVSLSVASTVATGTYSIHLKATDGTSSASATMTLKVMVNPDAKFQGCWYKTDGHRYQGALVSVANPGTYSLDAELYYGTTCNPDDWADEIGFGTDVNFGGFDWIFYFNAFADQSDMSTRWHVGPDTSACFAYTATTPACP